MSDQVPSEDLVLRIVLAAKEHIVSGERVLQEIKAPHTIYEAEVASIKTNIDQAFIRLPSASSPSDASRLRDDIVKYGGELKDLEYQYKANVRDKEVAYEEQRRSVLEKLCRNLVTTLGLPLVESTVQGLSNRESSGGQGGSSRTRRGRSRAEPNQRPAPSTAEHKPTTGAAHPKNSGGTASGKRGWDGVGPSNQHKRPRPGNIHFDQVFENGQAQTKRIIVQHPKDNGRWYIVRCDEHDLDFRDRPVVSAGSHISSRQHGKLSREAAVVIEHFGTEVLGCDRVLAEKNNAITRAAFKMARPRGQSMSTVDEPSSTQPGRSRTQPRRDALSGGNRRSQRREPVVDPTPGDVYLGLWGKAKNVWAVLLLPTKDISDVGVRGTIEGLGLTEKVPACYDYDQRTKEFRWAEGYEDGGSLVTKRKFPVLYFDGRRNCRVGWLGAKDLVPFDAESTASSNVPHIESVREYLRRRAREVSADTTDSSVIGRGRQESSPSPRADRHNPGSPPSYDSEASIVPQTDPSDGPSDTRSNLGTSINDQFGQSDSPPEEPNEGRPHEDLLHSIGQAPVPKPTVGKRAAISEERGPVDQQYEIDAPISTVVGEPDVRNLERIAQDAQRAAEPEKIPSPVAQDARSSPAAHVSRNPIPASSRHTQPSSALCVGSQGMAPGAEQRLGGMNPELPRDHHLRQSGAVAGPQDLNSAHHSTNGISHRVRGPEEEGETVRGPLRQLHPILPAPNRQRMPSQVIASPSLRLPPIQPPQGQATPPQLERLTSLLGTVPPAPACTPLSETAAQGGRPSVSLKPAAFRPDDPSSRTPEVSTTIARPTPCALDDLDVFGNRSWSLILSNRLLNLLGKYSTNGQPHPNDFKDAQNLYHCPVCEKKFVRQKYFTRHLFDKH